MNTPDSSTSAHLTSAFHSTTRNLCRVITWGAFSILPALFAANGPPPGIPPVNQPVNVQVINTEAAPVQTQDVDNPAFQPFQRQIVMSYPEGLLGSTASVTVPAGKRLVIEQVSIRAVLAVGQNPTSNWIRVANLTDPSDGVEHYFPAPLQGNSGPGVNVYVGTTRTRLYCNPGSIFQVNIRRNLDTGSNIAAISISGYYVNVQ